MLHYRQDGSDGSLTSMFGSSSLRSRASVPAVVATTVAAVAAAPPTVALGAQLPLARLAGDMGDALASLSTSCLVSIEPAERAETVEDDGRLSPPTWADDDDDHSPGADPANACGHFPDAVAPAGLSVEEPAPAPVAAAAAAPAAATAPTAAT